MSRHIFLDSLPLSLLATPVRPNNPLVVVEIRNWAQDCLSEGNMIVIPEIVDYEVRRELLRSGKSASVAELDRLRGLFHYQELTTGSMQLAAELWAQVRRQGLPTASDANIDVDVILAAQALSFGLLPEEVIIATVNPRHLSRFVTADLWQNIYIGL